MSQSTIDDIASFLRAGISIGRTADLLGLDVWSVANVAASMIYRRRR